MDESVWSLLFKLEADNAQLRRVLDDTERRLGNLEGTATRSSRNVSAGLSQMSRGAGQVASGLDRVATRATVAAVGGLALVVKTAVDFEDAFAGVRKTVDATPAALSKFREELRGMSREIPIAVDDLARIAEAGGALGVGFDPKTGETNLAALKEFTRVSALLGETTDVSSDQAATSLGVLSNVLGLLDKDYGRFGSTLVDLGNKGASTESQILAIAERSGAGAKLIHMSAAETLGWSSAIANLGIEVEAGGTSLQTFFTKSLQMIAAGGDELEVYAKTAGMAKDEFAELFGRDSSAALTAFIEGLGDLEEAERLAVLKALGFNDIRISRALLGLSGDVDNLTDSLKIADEAWESNSALGAEAAKRFETTRSQLMLLKNNAIDAAITIGDELLPIVNAFAKDAVSWLIAHRGDIKDFGEDLAQGIRGLGDSLKSTDWSALLSTLQGAASIAKASFDAFMNLPDPIKQILLAAIVGNKVTGGALFDITKGVGNLLGGAAKIGFGLRGASPGNPLWVQMVGGIPGVGGGPAGGGKGLGGVLAAALRGALGPAFAASLGASIGLAIGVPIFNATVKPAQDFERGEFGDILASGDPDRIRRAIEVLDEELGEWATKPPQVRQVFQGVIDEFQAQRDALAAALPEGMTRPAVGGGRVASGEFGSGDVVRADEVLLRDFGGKLDTLATNEVLEHLSRTTEIGLKDVGTSFQTGIKTGMDPLGDIATRILQRAENPLAPAVMNEIQGHIAGLEEIQQTYLDRGDINLAQKVQDNIDALNDLIGSSDEHRGVTERLAEDARSNDAAMLQTAERARAGIEGKVAAAAAAASSDRAMLNNTGLNTKSAIHAFNASEGTRFANLTARVDAMHGTLRLKRFSSTTNVFLNNRVIDSAYTNTAGFAEGTWSVPGTGLAMLHEGEMVVPRFDAEAFRAVADNGVERPNITVPVTVQGDLRARDEYDIARQVRRVIGITEPGLFSGG